MTISAVAASLCRSTAFIERNEDDFADRELCLKGFNRLDEASHRF